MAKLSLQVNAEEVKRALASLPEEELKQLLSDIRKDGYKAKTVKLSKLRGLIGIASAGGDAVVDSEGLYNEECIANEVIR